MARLRRVPEKQPYHGWYTKDPEDRTYDETLYDSASEAIRAWELNLYFRERPGFWTRQVPVRLGADRWTRMDFCCHEEVRAHPTMGKLVYHLIWYEEIYGNETKDHRDRWHLWAKYGPAPLFIRRRNGTGWDTRIIK